MKLPCRVGDGCTFAIDAYRDRPEELRQHEQEHMALVEGRQRLAVLSERRRPRPSAAWRLHTEPLVRAFPNRRHA